MRHRKQSPPANLNLIRPVVLAAALAAGSVLGSGTALAGGSGGPSSHGPDTYDPDVIDIDADYVQVEDTLDGIGDFVDAGSTIS